MIFATIICLTVFFFVVWTVNPQTSNIAGFLLFYISLFLSLVGAAAIAGFLVRFVGLKRDLIFRSVKEAFRQSFLFAFLIVASLVLLSHDLFSMLNLILLIMGISVLEYFLISNKSV
ncbi:MAG: hypothetical protein AAB906_05150 [Patescibacteria group bacterium]